MRPRLEGTTTSVTALVGVSLEGPLHEPVPVASVAAAESAFGAAGSMVNAIRLFFANGGRRAEIVRVGAPGTATDDDVSAPSLEMAQRGLWALEHRSFDLLCVLPLADGRDAAISARSRTAALALCQRKRAFFIVDPLPSWTSAEAMLDGPDGIESDAWGLAPEGQAAVYVPWLLTKDGALVAPSAAAAGVMARFDERRGVWRAPAGTEAQVEGVGRVSDPLTDEAQLRLNREGINVVRAFPGRGHLLWGARTLAGKDALTSDWKYISVRRLGLYVERSIDEGTRWAALEPNAEPLWADLRRVITEFMSGLFRAGAFAGRTDRETWFVKCDRQTTTQRDIDAGRVQVIVGFAPLKPAEFVILQFAVGAKRPGDDD